MSDAILIIIILLPLLLAYFLKSNAALGFLALCTGYAVQSFGAADIKNLLNITSSTFISSDTVSLLLITLPAFITMILCRGPASRKFTSPKVFLNLLVALAVGGSFAIMATPFFAYIGSVNLNDSNVWSILDRSQSEIVSIGALLALIYIWMGHRKNPHADKDKRKK